MKFHDITKDDMKNGSGLRVVLWVSGCNHHCKNCQNPVTWDPDCGVDFDDNAKAEIFEQLDKSYISGITFSGGDPLYPGNRDAVSSLIKEIKQKYPDKTIWLYTGYLWKDIKDIDWIKDVDVVVDGKFVEELADNKLHWVGSSNQKVVDVKASLKLGVTVLIE